MNTSADLKEAIRIVTGEEKIELFRPDGSELVAIVEIVTNNGQFPSNEFYWKGVGFEWEKHFTH